MWSSILIDYIENKLSGVPYIFKESPFLKSNSSLRKAGLNFEMTPEEKETHQALLNDLDFFTKTIETDVISKKPFKIREYQIELINNYENSLKYLIFSSRQSGIKTVLTILSLHYLMKNPNKKMVVFFTNKDRGEYFISNMESLMCTLKFCHRPGVVSSNKYSFTFDNGSQIETMSYNAHSSKNFDPSVYDWVIFSDSGHVKDISKYFNQIEKHETKYGKRIKVWALTTGFTFVNYFCELFDKAQKENTEYNSARISWRQVIDQNNQEEWKSEMILNLGSTEEFDKQYDCKYLNPCQDYIHLKLPLKDLTPDDIDDIKSRYGKYIKQ